MPKLSLDLEEQLSDSRSNESAYRLKVTNLGSTTLNLISLSPQIPDLVELVEVKDSSTVAAKGKHESLCEELTQLLYDYIFVDVEEVQNRILEIKKRYWKEFIKDANTFWRVYLNIFTGTMEKRMEKYRKEDSSLGFKINSSVDAVIAIEKWLTDTNSKSNALIKLFNAKLEQLINIEKEIGGDANFAAMATIEPDSFYATTYVLKFKRSLLNTKKFTFSVEGRFTEKDKVEDHLESVSTSVAISPRPYILSFITVLSALLGVSLKFSIQPECPVIFGEFFNKLAVVLSTGQGISSGILALVIFNIFEYTSLDDKIKLGISWRSALLVGVLSGLFAERMIESLKVLVGS